MSGLAGKGSWPVVLPSKPLPKPLSGRDPAGRGSTRAGLTPPTAPPADARPWPIGSEPVVGVEGRSGSFHEEPANGHGVIAVASVRPDGDLADCSDFGR